MPRRWTLRVSSGHYSDSNSQKRKASDVSTAIGIILTTLLALVIIWVAIFGTAGAMLAKHAGLSRPQGLCLGASLGPIGLIVLLIRRRRNGQGKSVLASSTTNSQDLPIVIEEIGI